MKLNMKNRISAIKYIFIRQFLFITWHTAILLYGPHLFINIVFKSKCFDCKKKGFIIQ